MNVRSGITWRRGEVTGYDVVRVALAAILLVAAGLKTHQLATEPVASAGLLDSRWFLIGVVELELFFGLWLLSGTLPKATWAAALACFGLFTCVSLNKALSGEASCGCFGRVPVNPWYTATLDLALVLSLLRWRPRLLPSPFGRGAWGEGWGLSQLSRSENGIVPLPLLLVIWLCVGIPAALAMGSYEAGNVTETGDILGGGQIVVLEPETWIGKRFALLPDIDIGEQLAEGEWIVLLYHHDCPDCQKAILEHERLARRSVFDRAAPRVALIDVPSYGNTNSLKISSDAPCAFGRLSGGKEWFVQTPVVLNITDSRTTGVFTE